MNFKSSKIVVLSAVLALALSASAMACGVGDYSGGSGKTSTEDSGQE